MTQAHGIQRGVFFSSAIMLFLLGFSGVVLPTVALTIILALLVAVVGLPHGALDPLVAREAGLWRDARGLAKFLAIYLLLAAIAGLLWVWAPRFSLGAFLAYSAWHFSGDWRDWLARGWRLCAGVGVISAPSLLHPELVGNYFSVLTGHNMESMIRVLQWLAVPALCGTLISGMLIIRKHPTVAAELAVLAVSALFLPPLVFFLLYFCGLHSPRHLIDTAKAMKRSTATATAAGLTLLTVGLGILFFYLLPTTQADTRFLQITFIGLSILTVPHMILVEHYAGKSRTISPPP